MKWHLLLKQHHFYHIIIVFLQELKRTMANTDITYQKKNEKQHVTNVAEKVVQSFGNVEIIIVEEVIPMKFTIDQNM